MRTPSLALTHFGTPSAHAIPGRLRSEKPDSRAKFSASMPPLESLLHHFPSSGAVATTSSRSSPLQLAPVVCVRSGDRPGGNDLQQVVPLQPHRVDHECDRLAVATTSSRSSPLRTTSWPGLRRPRSAPPGWEVLASHRNAPLVELGRLCLAPLSRGRVPVVAAGGRAVPGHGPPTAQRWGDRHRLAQRA